LLQERLPNSIYAFIGLGHIASAEENHDLAIEYFKAGTKQQGMNPAIHLALIQKFLQLFCYDEARHALDIAIKIFPDHVMLRRLEYLFLRAIGRVDRAIDLAQTLNYQQPNNVVILHDLVNDLIELGEFDRAVKLIESHPNHSHKDRLIFLNGKIAMAQFKLDESIKFIDAAILINENETQYHQLRLSLNLMLGNCDAAQNDLSQLKKIFEKKGWSGKKLKSVGGFPANVLREIKLNPYANKILTESIDLPLVNRISAVGKILRDEPNHLGSAVCFLSLLSQAGKLQQGLNLCKGEATTLMPRNIVQFWNEKEIPIPVMKIMQSWKDVNPSFHYQVFDDQSAEEFLDRHFSSDTVKAFKMANHPAMRADLFRLAYLYECGGICSDADDLCINPINGFIDAGLDLILLQEPTGTIANNFLAVNSKHPFVQFALTNIVNNIVNKAGGIWFVSGPGALTLCFCEMYISYLERGQFPPGVGIKQGHNLRQYVAQHLSVGYKKTKNGWNSPAGLAHPIYRTPRVSIDRMTR
jgi:tetratricopeptide (TPR) repeat protein